ncbi:MAG: DUF4337 domain-containing protein [Bryobacteraceae bacterium]
MAELEIHHEGHEADPFGQRIGVTAAIIAVFLAAVTIMSHRSHTDAVIFKTEANDKWAFYQAKSIKRAQYDIAERVASKSQSGLSEEFHKESERYKREDEEIQKEAQEKEAETRLAEHKALKYDLGEGLLELGLVLCSLYFISKKKLFPTVGLVSAVAGVLIASLAFLP